MKSLSKADLKRRDEIADKIIEAATPLDELRDAIADAVATYNEQLEKINEALEEARGYAEDIASEIEGYIDERSDAWRNGDKGSAYAEWLNEWQAAELDDVEGISVEADEIDADDLAAKLRDLPIEPGE